MAERRIALALAALALAPALAWAQYTGPSSEPVASTVREVLAQQTQSASPSRALQAARRWLHRDADKVPATAVAELAEARATYPVLDQMVTMREELRQLWLNTGRTREQLVADLQAWCQRAEASGIAALSDFSRKLRAVRVAV